MITETFAYTSIDYREGVRFRIGAPRPDIFLIFGYEICEEKHITAFFLGYIFVSP